MNFIAILGRQPKISLAEAEAVFGANSTRQISTEVAEIESAKTDILKKAPSLGGSQKIGRVIDTIPSTDWSRITNYLQKNITSYIPASDGAKIRLGFSVYGHKLSPGKLNATGLGLKKIIRAGSQSIRIIPNKELSLGSAQVLRNKLTSPNGYELLIVKDGKSSIIAQTYYIQDIDSYATRDHGRPARDARVGMLPPKLAQIIINLSGFSAGDSLLDPFCGTGVVLQEALLAGAKHVYGSDLEPRMVDYTNTNLAWLNDGKYNSKFTTKVADATSESWAWSNTDVIACETYLGRPLSSTPSREVLRKIISDCDTIHKKFLRNVAKQTPSGFRMCIAVPAWRTGKGFKSLPTLDFLSDLGYNHISFKFAGSKDLIYYRPGQQVARELVVLERI